MADDVQDLEDRLRGLVAALSDRQMKVLNRRIARALQTATRRRITAQVSPQGVKWAPRKKREGLGDRKKMLLGLRQARVLVASATSDQARIGYSGIAATIARIHHDGKVDKVGADGPSVKYPSRPVLGITEADKQMVLQLVTESLAGPN